MKTATFYIVASGHRTASLIDRFPTRELADAQASVWNYRCPTIRDEAAFVVVEVELPVGEEEA